MIKLDLNKIPDSAIVTRSYENKNGETVTLRELELETKDLREIKEITKSKDGSKTLFKTGFLALKSTKNGDGTWTNGAIVGDVLDWRASGGYTQNEEQSQFIKDYNDAQEKARLEGEQLLKDIPF